MESAKGKMSPELEAYLAKAKAFVEAMAPAEREELYRQWRESWARAEASWPKPKFKYVNGVKVYDSIEDYHND